MSEFFLSDRPSPHEFSLDNVLVIIPVLNEEKALGGVIRSLQHQGLNYIRVVDNGSTDHSAEVAKANGADVLTEPQRGYGQACWKGLQNMPDWVQWVLFCDGDGSDDLSQLPHFFTAAPRVDFLLANRRATSNSRAALTWAQNAGNGLAVFLIWMGWGYRYSDLGPLRLIRRSHLDHIQMQDRGFGWTLEMQVRAIECGLRIQEVPMNYGDRQGGCSKISGTLKGIIQAGMGILGTLAKFYWRKWRQSSNPAIIKDETSIT